MTRGKYIVLEGPQGVGKSLQLQLLASRLKQLGKPVRILREPDSQSDLTARAIRAITQDPRYPMNTRTEVLLYNAARATSLLGIKASNQNGVNCLVDRNYLTTLAIQFYGRADVPDYQAINEIINFAVGGIEPDLTVIFDAPVEVLKERIKDRYQGERFDDLDEGFLERVRAGYLWEAKQRNLPVVFAVRQPADIASEVWSLVEPVLNRRDTERPVEATATSIKEIMAEPTFDNLASTSPDIKQPAKPADLLVKDKTGFTITDDGRNYLKSIVSDDRGDIYAFSEELSPVTIAAAMARLSRRGDDMRITLLDEFAGKLGKDSQLLKRVITAYGDDSVQQLAGLHLVVENASNLLTKKLEWGRLAAYLEQSTRYIYFDKKDKNGHYRYYLPHYLESSLKQLYVKTMNQIFDLYSKMVHELTDYIKENSSVPKAEQDTAWQGAVRAQACDAVRPVLPTATKSTVGIYASAQSIESIIMHLVTDDLPEADAVGRQILTQARKVMPAFLERIDVDERGIAAMGYRVFTKENFKELAKKKLRKTISDDFKEPVRLVDYWPKNEMLLVSDMLYEVTGLSRDEIEEEVAAWSYADKLKLFKAYIGDRYNRRHRPGRALERAHYSWDIVCDYGIFRDLQRHRMVDDFAWQKLTPRYGYEIPELVEEAGLSEAFEKCFDLSLKLYDELDKANYKNEAQYATLLGHKMRWKLTYNAREAFHLHELRSSPQGHPGYRRLTLELHEKLAEVHPVLAEAMKFVNKAEDPELTRLAAERYTQQKLAKLSKTK